jgi:hypothetical protein
MGRGGEWLGWRRENKVDVPYIFVWK